MQSVQQQAQTTQQQLQTVQEEAKQKEAERLGKELQEAALKISFGPGSPEEKTRTIMQLQEEFQTKIKRLYGT